MAQPFDFRRLLPGYDALAPKQMRECVDDILAWPQLGSLITHLEKMTDKKHLECLAWRDRYFVKRNTFKALDQLRSWQGISPGWISITLSVLLSFYLTLLPIALCISLGLFREFVFELRSICYYFVYLCMVLAYSLPTYLEVDHRRGLRSYTTLSSLIRLRRDMALTMEVASYGYSLAWFVPAIHPLYANWRYSFVLSGITVLSIFVTRFLPVYFQDRRITAFQKRKKLARQRVASVQGDARDDGPSTEAEAAHIAMLDVLEPAAKKFETDFCKRQGHAGHNTQNTLVSEGLNNLIRYLYSKLPDDIAHRRLAVRYPTEEAEDPELAKAKRFYMWIYLPFGILNIVALAIGKQFGSLTQSIIALVDVETTLFYRWRNQNYGMPAYLDFFTPVFFFAVAGQPVAWTAAFHRELFTEINTAFWLFFVFMFAMTFFIGPPAIHYVGVYLKRKYDREAYSKQSTQLQPVSGDPPTREPNADDPNVAGLPIVIKCGPNNIEYWWKYPSQNISDWMRGAALILSRRPLTPPEPGFSQTKNEAGDALSTRDTEVQTHLFERFGALGPNTTFIAEEELGREGCLTTFPERMDGDVYYVVADPIDGTGNFLDSKGDFAIVLICQYGQKPFFALSHLQLRERQIAALNGDGVRENGKIFNASFRSPETGKLIIAYGTGKLMGEKATKAFLGHLSQMEDSVELRRLSCLSASVMAVADGEADAYITGKENATKSNALVFIATMLGMEVKYYLRGANENGDQRMIFARPGFIEKYVPDDGWMAKFLGQKEFNEGDYQGEIAS